MRRLMKLYSAFGFGILVVGLLMTSTISDAWLLAQLGLNESYRVKHLSAHFSRVFLSISVESDSFPTLIEAQWPQTYLPTRATVFPPYGAMHANGDHTDCSRIHQASWSQVDSVSRLWVMDIGWQKGKIFCSPKLIVFDLMRENVEVLRIDCGKYIKPTSLREPNIVLAKLGPKRYPCRIEKYIYFILSDNNLILAYDILEQNWHRWELFSKKFNNVEETFRIQPNDLAFGLQNEIFVSDINGQLYKINDSYFHEVNQSNIVESENVDSSIITKDMDLVGSLLGLSKGMMINHLGLLFYMVPKFGAIVRCRLKSNLTAESNEIIYMTSKNIQQIFFGNGGSIWLLSDRLLKPDDRCFSDI